MLQRQNSDDCDRCPYITVLKDLPCQSKLWTCSKVAAIYEAGGSALLVPVPSCPLIQNAQSPEAEN